MPKPKVFVSRIIRDKGLHLVKDFCDADLWADELPPPRLALLERVRGVDGLLALLTDRIDDELLDAAGPQLKVVSNHAVGVDNVDIPACTRRGIPVGNTPGILTDATADFAFALLLAAARRVVEADAYVRQGRWKTWGPSILLGADVARATLGIIGYGRIGRAVAQRAMGFNMRILVCDPNPLPPDEAPAVQAVDLETLLRQSDFVSLHTPLTTETRGLIGANELAKMKPTAILINTSRGPVVDQQALYEALRERRIAAAALDVTDPEPLPMDSPLLRLDNLLIAPHIASASRYSRDMMAYLAAQNLIAGLKGERLPNCVNPEVYQ
jgi:lactate dehydrogenase-like 2-hydroxyacid dehydrogenase